MKIKNMCFVIFVMVFELGGAVLPCRLKEFLRVRNMLTGQKSYSRNLEFNNAQRKNFEYLKIQEEANKALIPAGFALAATAGLGGAVAYKEVTRVDNEPKEEQSWVRKNFGRNESLPQAKLSDVIGNQAVVDQNVGGGQSNTFTGVPVSVDALGKDLGWRNRFFADLNENYNPWNEIKSQFKGLQQIYGFAQPEKLEQPKETLEYQQLMLEERKANKFFAQAGQLIDQQKDISRHSLPVLKQQINQLFKNEFGTTGSLYSKHYESIVKDLIAQRVERLENEQKEQYTQNSFGRAVYWIDDRLGMSTGLGKMINKLKSMK